MAIKKVGHPVINIIWNVQTSHFLHQHRVLHAIKRFTKI